jgi:regulator of sigma E protease
MELVFGIIVGLVILTLLVVAHELGHAIQARRNGVVVEEFGIGIPPCAWKRKLRNGVVFSLNWLPLGGFVKLKGEYDSADKKGDYGAATWWQKTKILLAGVAVNWLLAAIILSVLALTGLPKILSDQVTIPGDTTVISNPVEIVSLTANYPAEKAGLHVGDTIVRFAHKEVPNVDGLIDLIKQNKDETVSVIYNRDGVENDVRVKLDGDETGGLFGAGLGQRELIKATWSAPIVGVATAAQFTWVTLQGTGEMLCNLIGGLVGQFSPNTNVRQQASSDIKAAGENVAGPIGILGIIFPAAERAGLTQLLFLTAIISLSLAAMNILPIPALDGGRWVTMVAFRLFRKKLTKEREEKIQMVGFSILMGLIVLVTFVDVAKLF